MKDMDVRFGSNANIGEYAESKSTYWGLSDLPTKVSVKVFVDLT